MPASVMPQLLLCGLFARLDEMAPAARDHCRTRFRSRTRTTRSSASRSRAPTTRGSRSTLRSSSAARCSRSCSVPQRCAAGRRRSDLARVVWIACRRRLRHPRRGNDTPVPGTAHTPDYISLKRHRDDRHLVERSIRWGVVALLTAVAVADSRTSSASTTSCWSPTPEPQRCGSRPPARCERSPLPGEVRGRRARTAQQADARPRARLVGRDERQQRGAAADPELEPRRRRCHGFGLVAAGRRFTIYLYLKVNPTTAGRRDQSVELRDGNRTLASIDRSVNVFP